MELDVRPSPPRSWRVRALGAVWLLGAGVVIAALGGELWQRVEHAATVKRAKRFRDANVFFSSEMAAAHGSVWAKPWFKYRPNARLETVVGGERFVIVINSRGYRTHEFAVPKPAGLVRVVCIGGSTTVAGRTNDETYPALLETKLRARRPGLAVEVLNLGTSGVTTEYWRSRLDRVMALDPDLVVQYQAINDIAWRHFPRYAQEHRLRGWAYHSLLLERLWPFPAGELDPYLRQTLDTLDAIATACRERGIDYLAASFAAPDYARAGAELRGHLDVDTEFWTQHFPLHSYATYAAILARYDRLFVDFVQRRHLAHVLVHEQIQDPALFVDSCHFTPAGIERLAEAFLPQVEALVTARHARRVAARAAGTPAAKVP